MINTKNKLKDLEMNVVPYINILLINPTISPALEYPATSTT